MSSRPLLGHPGEGAPLKLVVGEFHGGKTSRANKFTTAVWLFGPLVLGSAIGWFAPVAGEPCSGLPPAVERLSTIVGWIYFSAWSISFYPQVWLNWGRKSVAGLSLDFQVLNMVGFTCYAIYNSALYWNPTARQEYALENDGAMPAVHANDVFFAIHAAVLTAVTLVQCCIHDRGGQVPSRLSLAAASVVTLLAALYGAVVGFWGECVSGSCERHSWYSYLSLLNWLYFLSFVKLGISLVKYIPQVLLNYRRKSTVGWNIWNVLLDFEGGALSLAQLLMDSGVTKDWSPVTGNPVKFGLGFASMFFDVIFMAQHYILYPEPQAPRTPLPSYPTEAACGNCGQPTCSCIHYLAHPEEDQLAGCQHQLHHEEQGGDLEAGAAASACRGGCACGPHRGGDIEAAEAEGAEAGVDLEGEAAALLPSRGHEGSG